MENNSEEMVKEKDNIKDEVGDSLDSSRRRRKKRKSIKNMKFLLNTAKRQIGLMKFLRQIALPDHHLLPTSLNVKQ